MKRSPRIFLLSAVFAASLAIGLVSILVANGDADASNPPNSVLATAMIDPFEAEPDNDVNTDDSTPVLALLEANGRYYVGGDFAQVGGESQRALVAIEVATGQVDPDFRPAITGSGESVQAIAISPNGNDLYIAGRFLAVDGVAQRRVAKLDATTGAVDPNFVATTHSAVESIVTDGTSVWIGGLFTEKLLKLNAATGAVDASWAGTPDGNVLDLELSGNTLWVGGNFNNIAGQAVPFLAPLDKNAGTVTPAWNPTYPEDQKVLALSPSPDGSMIYVGTAGTVSNQGNAIRAYTTDGTVLWERAGGGDVQAIEASSTTVFGGTHGQWQYTIQATNIDNTPNNGVPGEDSNLSDTPFPANGYVEDPSNTNAVRREKFFALDAATGAILAWDPHGDSTDGVWELTSGASGLLAGGDFRSLVNPTGTAGQESTVFTPHMVVFANRGRTGNDAPEPLFTVDCAGTACNVDASGSLDDGSISSYSWNFGNGQTASGAIASAVLANNAVHNITLTVTDNTGLTAQRTQKVMVGNGGLPVTPVATTTVNGTNNQFDATLPATASPGDIVIAFLSVTDSGVTATAPVGWIAVADQVDGNLRTHIWWKQVGTAEAGTDARFQLSSSVKADLTVSTFDGVDGTNPILAVASQATSQRQAEHTAPGLSFAGEATVLQYWAERTSAGTELFGSPELATLSTSIGAGQARINSTLGVLTSTRTTASPQGVAISEHHNGTALGWSLALKAGPSVVATPVDTTAPVVTFGSATSLSVGVTDLSGGVTDDLSGVDRMRVLVRNSQTGQYWNGTSWQAAWAWVSPTVAGSSWTLSGLNLDAAGDYTVQLWAWDNEDNRAAWQANPQPVLTAAAVAVVDTTAPVVTFGSATSLSVGVTDLSGGVTDDLSGVDRMRVLVRNSQTGQYWNGTSWQAAWAWVSPTVAGSSWTLSGLNLDAAGDYTVQLWAWDNEDNRAAWQANPQPVLTAAAVAVVDTTAPVVTFGSATSLSVGVTDLSGGVTDDLSGVDRMRVLVRNSQTGQYWNGTAWQAAWIWVTPTLSGNAWTLSGVNLDAAGGYTVLLWAWDDQNNLGAWQANPQPILAVSAVAVADVTPPVVTFASPTSLPVGVTDLSGGVTDDLSGVDRMRVRIQNSQTDQYWNGTSWQTSWTWATPAIVGNSWTLPNVNLDAGGTYTVLFWAWDNNGNRGGSADNLQPTLTVN